MHILSSKGLSPLKWAVHEGKNTSVSLFVKDREQKSLSMESNTPPNF